MWHRTGIINGVDNTLLFTQHWLPQAPPQALLILVHGLGEHSDRYEHLAWHFVQEGYGVFALDHRGHGRSEGERVLVNDFTDYFVADLRLYAKEIQATYPDLPVVLYGHSMGSLIALLYAFQYQDELAALVTTGTALKPVNSNAVTAPVLKTASSIIPGARLIALDANGISRDPLVTQAYIADPLVYHGRIPLVTLAALQEAADQCIDRLPGLRVPYLALHGSADPLTMVKGADIILERSGARDTMVKIYEGFYHEIHNEPEHEQVFRDVTSWLSSRII